MRDLHQIFSPLSIVNWPDAKLQSVISEPHSTQRQRAFLNDRVKKLEEGQEIFRDVVAA